MMEQEAHPPSRPSTPLVFQSLSEYACAKMLEKYAGWSGIGGATFQVKVGRAVFDFRIGDTFVEYHPISLRREFLTSALRNIMSVAHRLNRRDKLVVLEAMSTELAAQYAKRRSQTLSAHPSYGSMQLICVHSPEEFAQKALYRLANRKCPSVEVLTREFRALQKGFNKTHRR